MKTKTMNSKIDLINERIYLYLLSWIKSEEYTKIETIQNNIHLEYHELEKMIFKMHESDLVIQKSGFVFISEYANSLLSTIGIGNEITKKMVKKITYNKDSEVFEELLQNFQDKYYDSYLSTIGVLKSYFTLADTIFDGNLGANDLSIYLENVDTIIYNKTKQYQDLYSSEYDDYLKYRTNTIKDSIALTLNAEKIIKGDYGSFIKAIDEINQYNNDPTIRFGKISKLFTTTMSVISTVVQPLLLFAYVEPVVSILISMYNGINKKSQLISTCKELVIKNKK